MKIHDNETPVNDIFPKTKSAPQAPAGPRFGDILNESVENAKKEDAKVRATTFINSLNGIQMVTPSNFDKASAIDRTEKLIGLLDQYRHQLADPLTTLKNIDPLIRKIDQEKENLAPALESLPEDEDLKRIINQTLVTASLEVSKFYRGDYNAP